MNTKEEGGEDEILAKTATTERKQMKSKERRIGRFSSLVGLFTEPIFIVVAPSWCVKLTPPFPLVAFVFKRPRLLVESAKERNL
jgi:hypothetical protein